MSRDPQPLTSGAAKAKRAHLLKEGRERYEPEPGVFVVVGWSGEVARWVKRFASDWYERVSP